MGLWSLYPDHGHPTVQSRLAQLTNNPPFHKNLSVLSEAKLEVGATIVIAFTITEINNVMVGLFDNLTHPICNHKSSLAAFSFPDHGIARIKVLYPLKRLAPDCSMSC